MKTKFLILIALVLLADRAAQAQGNTFTYQGRLTIGTNGVNGRYDFQFRLMDSPTVGAGTQLGPIAATNNMAVTNGLFSLGLDFGAQFDGSARWLEIQVKTNNGATYSTLSPRQSVTPTPYAIYSANAAVAATATTATTATTAAIANAVANSGVSAASIQNGAVGSAQIADGSIGVNDLSPTVLNSTFWRLAGNAGANPTTGAFLGTTDNLPLEFRVNGVRGLRLEPNTNGAPNVIGGSPANFVAPGIFGAVIAGGGTTNFSGFRYTNSVSANFGSVGGGRLNTIHTNASFSTIGGGEFNSILTNAYNSMIGGGSGNVIQTNAYNSMIGGGNGNVIQNNASYSMIGGGANNRIRDNASVSTISGGADNEIQEAAGNATIGGGYGNMANSFRSTIGGGELNEILASANWSTIGGGGYNTIQPGVENATISGGRGNTAFAYASTICGGSGNTANANWSTIGGGDGNSVSGDYGVVPGGDRNHAYRNAFAVGHRANANYQGSFIWADSNDFDFAANAVNKVRFRCTSGFDIITGIDGSGGQTAGVYLPPGGNSWISVSDRNAKESFQPVDGKEVLAKVAAMPMTTWKYKSETEGIRHMGVMAQDFRAAFSLGNDERGIATVDADGVALAAIQGLNQRVNEKEAEIQSLKDRLNALEKLIANKR